MGGYDAVLARECPEQRVGIVGVGRFVGQIGGIRDLGVARAVDRLAFVPEMHIAIAAERRVGGPFVAWDADEPAGLVEFRRQRVELAPERGP